MPPVGAELFHADNIQTPRTQNLRFAIMRTRRINNISCTRNINLKSEYAVPLNRKLTFKI